MVMTFNEIRNPKRGVGLGEERSTLRIALDGSNFRCLFTNL